MRKTQCDKCHAYALYAMPNAGKVICASCQEIERGKIVNAGVKKKGSSYAK